MEPWIIAVIGVYVFAVSILSYHLIGSFLAYSRVSRSSTLLLVISELIYVVASLGLLRLPYGEIMSMLALGLYPLFATGLVQTFYDSRFLYALVLFLLVGVARAIFLSPIALWYYLFF